MHAGGRAWDELAFKAHGEKKNLWWRLSGRSPPAFTWSGIVYADASRVDPQTSRGLKILAHEYGHAARGLHHPSWTELDWWLDIMSPHFDGITDRHDLLPATRAWLASRSVPT